LVSLQTNGNGHEDFQNAPMIAWSAAALLPPQEESARAARMTRTATPDFASIIGLRA
jgi:hypothetical protein